MTEQDIEITEKGAVLQVTLSRTSKHNAMNAAIFEGLETALRRLEREPQLRVLLIRATGKYFSAGFDITALGMSPDDEGPAGFRLRYRESARHDLWDYVERQEKPVVVAHQGPCLGAGLEMSLSCDFRLASSDAAYGLPELNTGMIPGSGGTSRLVRAVGPHWARWFIMAGQRVGAEDARQMGLVHAVWPAEVFDEKVEAFCETLAAQPPEALAAAKLGIELAKDLDRGQGRNVERLLNSSLAGRAEQTRVLAAIRARFVKSEG
jgi:enoyl-CoA hydratase/carnithine racemase